MLEIVPEYPFELVSGEKAVKDVGIVQGYEADSTANIKIVKYRIQINKDAPAGSCELKVKYYYQDSTDMIQKSLYLDVKSRESVEVIHIDKAALVPGKQSSLKFTINNLGNAPLRDLIFNWENEDDIILPEQPGRRVSGSNSVIIGNLNKGDYAVAGFKLQRSMDISPETVLMQIAYNDTMGERKII